MRELPEAPATRGALCLRPGLLGGGNAAPRLGEALELDVAFVGEELTGYEVVHGHPSPVVLDRLRRYDQRPQAGLRIGQAGTAGICESTENGTDLLGSPGTEAREGAPD